MDQINKSTIFLITLCFLSLQPCINDIDLLLNTTFLDWFIASVVSRAGKFEKKQDIYKMSLYIYIHGE